MNSEFDFSEVLNLFMAVCEALGLADASTLYRFLEFVVYDTIRSRKEQWQVAQELLVIALCQIRISGGVLTFSDALQGSPFDTYLDEARHHARYYYPKLSSIFRSTGGNPGAESTGGTIEWNGGQYCNSKKWCSAFNSNMPHGPKNLFPDGTCKQTLGVDSD